MSTDKAENAENFYDIVHSFMSGVMGRWRKLSASGYALKQMKYRERIAISRRWNPITNEMS